MWEVLPGLKLLSVFFHFRHLGTTSIFVTQSVKQVKDRVELALDKVSGIGHTTRKATRSSGRLKPEPRKQPGVGLLL